MRKIVCYSIYHSPNAYLGLLTYDHIPSAEQGVA